MKGHRKPSCRFGVMGYDIFSRLCSGGKHFRHSDFPHGKVKGIRSGSEHIEHWNKRMMARASSCGLSPPLHNECWPPWSSLDPINASMTDSQLSSGGSELEDLHIKGVRLVLSVVGLFTCSVPTPPYGINPFADPKRMNGISITDQRIFTYR